jgi:hypothetical protein
VKFGPSFRLLLAMFGGMLGPHPSDSSRPSFLYSRSAQETDNPVTVRYQEAPDRHHDRHDGPHEASPRRSQQRVNHFLVLHLDCP